LVAPATPVHNPMVLLFTAFPAAARRLSRCVARSDSHSAQLLFLELLETPGKSRII
jgi:hypothetical protein